MFTIACDFFVILNQVNPVHALISYSFKIHYNMLPSAPMSQVVPSLHDSVSLLCVLHAPPISVLLHLITLVISVKTGNYEAAHDAVLSSLMLLPFSLVLSSETISIYAFLLEDEVSHPNKRVKIIVLYI